MLWFNLLFPLFGFIITGITLYTYRDKILSYLEKKVEDGDHDIDGGARKVTIITLCILFWIYVVALDCCAVNYRDNEKKLSSAVIEYHKATPYFYGLPNITLSYDLAMICLVFPIYVIVDSKFEDFKDKTVNEIVKWFLGLCTLYSLFAVLSIISVHLMYILIALINNPLHATGILIYYVIFIVLYLISMKKIITSSLHYCFKFLDSPDGDYGQCSCCCFYIILAIVTSIFLVGLGALIIVLNVYIPIKDSIHDIPQQIQYLFHFITTFLVGLITYKVLQKSHPPQKVEIVNLPNVVQ